MNFARISEPSRLRKKPDGGLDAPRAQLQSRREIELCLSSLYIPLSASRRAQNAARQSPLVQLDEFRLAVPFPTFFDFSTGEVAEKLVLVPGVDRFKREWSDARPKDAQAGGCRSIFCCLRPLPSGYSVGPTLLSSPDFAISITYFVNTFAIQISR